MRKAVIPLLVAAAVLVAAAPQPQASPSASQSATPAPYESLPPIAIELCVAEPQADSNPNLHVGIAFRDLTDADATTVRFDILVVDDSGKVLSTSLVSIDGDFKPNDLVTPRRSPLTGELLTAPGYAHSPAWNIPNHFGSGARSVRCELDSAEFADHTAWQRTPPL